MAGHSYHKCRASGQMTSYLWIGAGDLFAGHHGPVVGYFHPRRQLTDSLQGLLQGQPIGQSTGPVQFRCRTYASALLRCRREPF